MKYYNYKDLGIVSAKKPFNTHLFWEHSTYGLILVDSGDQTKLYISTDDGDNWVEIDLSDNANSYKIQAGWLDGNDLWLVMCDNDGTADDFEVCFIELDDSNDCNPIGVSAGADVNTVYAYDIFKLGADFYVLNEEKVAAVQGMVAWDVDTAPFVERDRFNGAFEELGFIVVVGTIAYFLYETVATDLTWFFSFNDIAGQFSSLPWAGGGPDSRPLDYTMPPINQKAIAYDGSDVFYFVLQKDADSKYYLWTYSLTGEIFTVQAEYNIALMMDRNTASGVLEKAFHLTEYKVYQLHPNLPHQIHLISTPASDNTLIGITDNFLMNDDGDMFEYIDIIYKLFNVEIIHEIMEAPIIMAEQKLNDLPLEAGMLMKFYHNYTTATVTAEEIVGEAFIEDLGQHHFQEIILVSPAKDDLEEKPVGDYSGRSDEILTSLVTDYFSYITKGTFSVGTAMGTITFGGNMTMEVILDELALFEGFVWGLTPTGVLYFNNGTVDSGENFTQVSPIFGIDPFKSRKEYNSIKVNGAYIDGVQMVSEWKEDLESQQRIGIRKREFDFGFLDTVALCNTAATNILSRLVIVPQEVKFNHKDNAVGFIQPGETVTFEYASSGMTIPSDQFIINKTSLNKFGIAIYNISSDLV